MRYDGVVVVIEEGRHESQRYNLAVTIWDGRVLDGDAEGRGLRA